MIESSPEVAAALQKIDLAHARKHLFFCPGPNCSDSAEGLKVWDYLKARVKELDLKVLRTKTECFRICSGGPWLVVYPDGVWYGAMTPERCERILREHIVGGCAIEEWVVARRFLTDYVEPKPSPDI